MPAPQMFPKGSPQGGTNYGFTKVFATSVADWRIRITKHLATMDQIHKEKGLPPVIHLAAPKGPADPTASPEAFKEMMDVITRPIDTSEPEGNQLEPDYDEYLELKELLESMDEAGLEPFFIHHEIVTSAIQRLLEPDDTLLTFRQ